MGVSLKAWTLAVGATGFLTGYVGQYYETGDTTPFIAWGLVSTMFYLVLLGVVYSVVFGHNGHLPADAARTMRGVWWLILVSWTLYPVAYAMPLIANTADGVVARQVVFTVTDISSKVVYGILLSRVAQIRSAADDYGPAVIDEAERLEPPALTDHEAAAESVFRDGRTLTRR